MLEGQRTAFFTDVKIPIEAGMEYRNGKIINPKIRKIGYDVFRLYYDNDQKDWQVGSERIKRIIKR